MECKPLLHKWNGCVCQKCGAIRDKNHEWNGCVCRRCSSTRHDYNTRNLSNHICSRCGEPNPELSVHTLMERGRPSCYCSVCLKGFHKWNGCTCTVCFKRNENHTWDGCICKICGTIRDNHVLKECLCTKCGKEFHEFENILNRDKDCNLFRTCKKCKKIEIIEKAQHEYILREDLQEDPCHKLEECKYCGFIQKSETHDFQYVRSEENSGPHGYEELRHFYKCKNCENIKTEFNSSDSSSRDW